MNTENDGAAVGVDVGTSRIVIAERAAGEIAFRAQLNAFVTIPYSKITESVLKKENISHTIEGSEIVVHGDESERFAQLLQVETRRPMTKGVLNPGEPDSLELIRQIIGTLSGPR